MDGLCDSAFGEAFVTDFAADREIQPRINAKEREIEKPYR